MHIAALRRLIVLAFILLFSPGILLACGSSTTSTSGTVRQPTSTSVPTAAPGQHFKIGQQVNVDNIWLVSLDSAKTSMEHLGFQPKPGQLFLNILLSMKNTSSNAQSVNATQFMLSDSTGHRYDVVIVSTLGDNPPAPGAKLGFGIIFVVPNNVHSFVLTFEADSTPSGHIVWDIGA